MTNTRKLNEANSNYSEVHDIEFERNYLTETVFVVIQLSYSILDTSHQLKDDNHNELEAQ